MKKVIFDSLGTEKRNKNTMHIDRMSTGDILKTLNNEDKDIPFAIEKKLKEIQIVVDKAIEIIGNNGRIIYLGAGSSGIIGAQDALEIEPTYNVGEDVMTFLIPGGTRSFSDFLEISEDDENQSVIDLKGINFSKKD